MCFIQFNMDIFVRTVFTAAGICYWMILPINGRMNGADPLACKSLIPSGHGTTQQTIVSPFVIETSATQYTPGGNIQVTIRTKQSDFNFRGFLLQARHAENTPPYNREPVQILGTWSTSNSLSKLLDCVGNTSNSVTHASKDYQSSVSFTWHVPDKYIGNIKFVATVVRDFWTWWTTESTSLSMRDPCISSPCPSDSTCTRTIEGKFICLCRDGSTTTTECRVMDPCLSNPCPVEATCTRVTGGLHTCLCPDGSATIGTSCTIVCNSNPCLNGGQCLGSDDGYTCQCRNGFTGTRCQQQDVCISNPCLNGGQCILSNGGYTCQCPSGFTDTRCQLQDLCSSRPCVNGGTCYLASSSSNIPYVCVCLDGFTGTYCGIQDPCLSSPCFNEGTCTEGSSSSTYICTCRAGYSGPRCEQVINTACDVNPCLNGGTCETRGTLSYTCQCRTGYVGTNCQTADNIACDVNPCNNGGICTTSGLISYNCECRNGFTGNNCDIAPTATCDASPCFYGGTCVAQTGGGYTCNCLPGYSGQNCGTITQITGPCSSNPCTNGGVCSESTGDVYSCQCSTGFTGPRCQIVVTVCDVNPCLNGGTCDLSGTSSYTCRCRTGFTGSNCQIVVNTACDVNPCNNGGTCFTSGTTYTCRCNTGFTGTNCQTVVNTACDVNPCNNGGTCVTSGTVSYNCQCRTGFTGRNCQTVVNTACDVNPCNNGGTCVTSGTVSYNCQCRTGFTGFNCQTVVNTLCNDNPCNNGGTCVTLGTASYTCQCRIGFTGTRCQSVVNPACDINQCINGGTCVTSGSSSYTCLCRTGFTGSNCQTVVNIACDVNPCNNGGTCVTSGTSGYICRCRVGFIGGNCQEVINAACFKVPCLNGGTCVARIGNASAYFCRCIDGYTGQNCQVSPNDPCSSNPCTSSATCSSTTQGNYVCTCPDGTTTTTVCIDACTPRPNGPCFNGGICYLAGQTDSAPFLCLCPTDFTGVRCERAVQVNPCQSSPCLFGGLCVEQSGGSYRCQCSPPERSGLNCQIPPPGPLPDVCNHNPCQYGSCRSNGAGYLCSCNSGWVGRNCDVLAVNGPVFEGCPANQIQVYELESGEANAFVDLRIQARGASNQFLDLQVVSGPAIIFPAKIAYSNDYRAGQSFTYRATDPTTGLSTDCRFMIRLEDTEPPVVTCPESIVTATFDVAMTVSWPPAFASDNLNLRPADTILYSRTNGSAFTAYGVTTPEIVEVRAYDTFNNEGVCTFEVTVLMLTEAPPPTFANCPDGEIRSYKLTQKTNMAFVDLSIQARDYTGQPAAITTIEGPVLDLPGNVVYEEAYRQGQVITLRASDANGITVDCSFTIKLIDDDPPEIKCPSNIIDSTVDNAKVISWSEAVAKDNLGLRSVNPIVYDPPNATEINAFKDNVNQIVTVTAWDSFNNEGICQFLITLYQVDGDLTCSAFPDIQNGQINCEVLFGGNMQCRVVCDVNYVFAPASSSYTCEVSNGAATWNPLPRSDGICISPKAGTEISRNVLLIYHTASEAGSQCENDASISLVPGQIKNTLSKNALCTRGTATACNDIEARYVDNIHSTEKISF
ncbi:uncharacterized protein [Amphiura filiformis]|uniref:uncharacterized protein n=1 Tax=Amphiura filiformis TaxID=82378 RepID=UPI003B215F78